MTKAQLIEKVAQEGEMTKKEAEGKRRERLGTGGTVCLHAQR